MTTIPFILYPGESDIDSELHFQRYVERVPWLNSLDALQASGVAADVRLE